MNSQKSDDVRGDRIRKKREELGLTQRELARLCGFSENQIGRYENAISDPYSTHLKTIAVKLNVSTDYLLGLTSNERGQLGDSDLSESERDIVEVFRRDGWRGVVRLGVDRMDES